MDMKWDNIIGQDRVKAMLQRCIIDRRIPQSLLLTGQEGAGSVAIALAFARTVNCLEPSIGASTVAPCEKCKACIQSIHLQHPNIQIITSMPAAKKGDSDEAPKDAVVMEIREAIECLAADPYESIRLTGATEIKIYQIRELKKSLSMSAIQDGRRVVIIISADEMRVEAANAFLKTLEEPHDDVTLILTSARPERLLQTIVSRCQEMIIPPLDDADIVRTLVDRGLCTEEEASIIAPFAQGNIQKAIDFLSEDVKALGETAMVLLRAALRGSGYRNPLIDAVNEASDGRNKARAESVVSLLSLWIRDAHAISVAGYNAQIVNIDQREALIRFSDAFGQADFLSVLATLEGASRDLARNVSVSLVLTTTMLELRRYFAQARIQERSKTL